MESEKNVSDFFLRNSKSYPIVRLLSGLRPHMEFVMSIRADVENGYACIKMPARYHFRFCDALIKQFAYTGLSFDIMVIDPKFKSAASISPADNVEVHIFVQAELKENRMIIKFKNRL